MTAEDELNEEAPQTDVAAEDEWRVQNDADEDKRRMSDEERAALLREQLKALRVVDVAHDMMLSLVTLGYQKLGLTDETRELRNLEDARLAIELLRGVMDVVGAATSEQMVAPFRSTLATMQLNFARVAAPPATADEAPAVTASDEAPATTASEEAPATGASEEAPATEASEAARANRPQTGEATPANRPQTGEAAPATEPGQPKPAAGSSRQRRATGGAVEDRADVADGGSRPADDGPDASDQGA